MKDLVACKVSVIFDAYYISRSCGGKFTEVCFNGM